MQKPLDTKTLHQALERGVGALAMLDYCRELTRNETLAWSAERDIVVTVLNDIELVTMLDEADKLLAEAPKDIPE